MINFDIDRYDDDELSISFDDPANPVDELQGYLFASDYRNNPVMSVLESVVCALYNSADYDFIGMSGLEYCGNTCAGYTLYDPFHSRAYYITNHDIKELLDAGKTSISNRFDDNDYCWRVMDPNPNSEGLIIGDNFSSSPMIYAISYKDKNDNQCEEWFATDGERKRFADDNGLDIVNYQREYMIDMRADLLTKWDDEIADDLMIDCDVEIAFCA